MEVGKPGVIARSGLPKLLGNCSSSRRNLIDCQGRISQKRYQYNLGMVAGGAGHFGRLIVGCTIRALIRLDAIPPVALRAIECVIGSG